MAPAGRFDMQARKLTERTVIRVRASQDHANEIVALISDEGPVLTLPIYTQQLLPRPSRGDGIADTAWFLVS